MTRQLIALAALALLGAAPAPQAAAVLNVQDGAKREGEFFTGGRYRQVERFEVPADHIIHDRLIAFEGPGWESDKVGYRLYLDERNAIDIFGKKAPAPILHKIGIGKDDYHAMADWGMDIFKAGDTPGAGGIGTIRSGKVAQLGPSKISAWVIDKGPKFAAIGVRNAGWRAEGGPADLEVSYGIAAGSRITHVEGSATGGPIVAGLTLHPGVERLVSGTGAWRYAATFGKQSLAGDELGIALFYRAEDVAEQADDGGTLYIRFRNPAHIRYAFAAVWQGEPGAPKGLEGFRTWLEQSAAELGER